MNLSKVDFASIHTPISDPKSLIIQAAGICGDPTVQNSDATPHHQETSRQETNNTLLTM
jgi:hypothetical protein